MKIVNLNTVDVSSWNDPETLIVYSTQVYDRAFVDQLRERFPALTILGLSSFHGVILHDGVRRGSYGLLVEKSDDVHFQASAVDLTDVDDVRTRISQHISEWIDTSRSSVRIYMYASAGVEERVIEGIQDVLGPAAHIFGATPANDKFLGSAYAFLNETEIHTGVVFLDILDSNCRFSITCGGFLPTSHTGIVTKAHGRTIETIDDRPACEVYNDWTEGMFSAFIFSRGLLPRSASLFPFGRLSPSEPDFGFWLSHPYAIEGQAVRVYAEIPVGSRICLMRGHKSQLISHARTAVMNALENVDRSQVSAACIIYCSGCAGLIFDSMDTICEQLCTAFGNIPFIGCTSRGEQGCVTSVHQNYHGNMMIEVILIMKSSASS